MQSQITQQVVSIKPTVPTAQCRAEFLAFHAGTVEQAIASGDSTRAAAHARRLAHGVMHWRALEIQTVEGCVYSRACQTARAELYGDIEEQSIDVSRLSRSALVAIGRLALSVAETAAIREAA